MIIPEKYNQEKESTIQYDVSKLLQTDLSDYLKDSLMNLGNPEVDKFVAEACGMAVSVFCRAADCAAFNILL